MEKEQVSWIMSSLVVPKPASLLLVNRNSMGSKFIAWGQRRKFPAKYAFWSHTAISIGDGKMVEALLGGVVISLWNKYQDRPHAWVEMDIDNETSARVVKFATHSVGMQYGKFELVSEAMWLATGTRWRATRNNQLICSAHSAESLTRTGAIFPEEPLWCTPAHLAQYYDIPWNGDT